MEKVTAASPRGPRPQSRAPELARSRADVRPAPGETPAARRLRLMASGDAALRGVVDRLLLESASAAEIAADLAIDAQAVRHLLRRLLKGEVVERGARSGRRGVSEFLYSCDPRRTALSSDHLCGLPARLVERVVVRVLRELFRESIAASASRSYYASDEYIAARFPLPLDGPGWRRGALLHEGLLDSIAEARERAGARLSRGAEPIEATAAILFFEIPGSSWPRPFGEGELPSTKVRGRSHGPRVEGVLALEDPLRARIVDALSLGPATAVELAAAIGAPLARVRYELRALEKAAMVKVQSRRERRGAIENVFIADSQRMTFSAEDLHDVGDRSLRDFGTGFARLVFGEAVEGARHGSFDERGDWHLSRTPLRLDPQGFAEISASMDATLAGLFELREECLARRGGDGGSARPAFSDLLLFERPNPMFEQF